MTIERLELLSDDVLTNLAKKIGVRTRPDWGRETLIESIIDAMDEDRIEKESLLNLAVSIESKKYSVTVDEELDLSYDVDEEMVLPERYNDDRLHFILRDNSWGFVMWDIKDSTHLEYQNKLGEVNYILRIIELDDPIFEKDAILDYFDIDISEGETSRYISLPHEESFYCVELILVSGDKEFLLKRSNVVKAPRNRVNYIDEDNNNLKKIVELSGYSVKDLEPVAVKSINRILPIDSMEEEK